MAITRFAKPAELPPIDFGFLAQQQQFAQARQDAASKNIDEATGMLAALNAAPGNEKWASEITSKYNEALGKISEDFGKVSLQQSISDARRIKAHFLSNPDVKTILNNKDYYDKILAPYMANKEAQLNVPGGTMAGYLEAKPEGGYNFKQNRVSYSGTLSYQPFADYSKWTDDQFKQAEYRLAEDLSRNGIKVFTEPKTQLLYYTEGGERKYIRNLNTFADVIDSTAEILMSGQNPESRFLLADSRWRGIEPTKESIKKMITPLATKYFGEKVEGKANVGFVPGQGDGNKTDADPTTPGTVAFSVGDTQAAIIPKSEEAKAEDYVTPKSYKTSAPEVLQKAVDQATNGLSAFTNINFSDLGMSRNYDQSKNQITYKLGITEDEFVNNFAPNQKEAARTQYKVLLNRLNTQALEEQNLIRLHDNAVNATLDQVFGKPSVGNMAIRKYVNTVENYSTAPMSDKDQLNRQIDYVKEEYLRSKSTVNPPFYKKYADEAAPQFSQEKYNQESKMLEESLNSGIIPPDFKKYLYRQQASVSPQYSQIAKLADANLDLFAENFKTEYQKDQTKNYTSVTFAPEGVTADKKTNLHRYQETFTKRLEPVKSTDGKTIGKSGGVMGLTYFVPGDNKSKISTGEYNAQELFNGDYNVNGVRVLGFIYDRENGWYGQGTLTGEDGGQEVFFKAPDMDNVIIDNLTANPNAGDMTNFLSSILKVMPYNEKAGTRVLTSGDPKVEQAFNKFGMNDIFIEGGENTGYSLAFKPDPQVASKMNPNLLTQDGYFTQNFKTLIDLGSYISNYATYMGKK